VVGEARAVAVLSLATFSIAAGLCLCCQSALLLQPCTFVLRLVLMGCSSALADCLPFKGMRFRAPMSASSLALDVVLVTSSGLHRRMFELTGFTPVNST
jgi:hypothetical protein